MVWDENMKNELENNCIGCLNIENGHFPFGERKDLNTETEGFFIDTEGCGITNDGDYFLKIYFCPVCGIKL